MDKLKAKAHALLERLEVVLKTDMKYLARGGFWLTAGQVASSLVSFCLAILFARFLSKEAYGTYKYIISATSVLSIFSLNGVDNALIQAIARGHEGSFMQGVRLKLKAGLIGSVASLGIAAYYFYKGNHVLSGGFVLAGIFLAFMNSYFLYDSLLQGQKRFRESIMYAVGAQLFTSIAIAITIILTSNVYILVAVYFISWTLARYYAYMRVVKHYLFNTNIDPKTISYGLHSSLIGIVAAVSGGVDSILIFHYLGAISLAVYTFALAPVTQIKSLFDKIPILAVPRFAGRTIEELESQFPRRLALLALTALVIVIGYFVLSPYFYALLFPKYLDSLPYSRAYALLFFLWLPYSVFAAALSAKLTYIPRNLLYLWNIPGIVTTLSIFLLTPRYGIMGVIDARILAACSLVIVGVFMWTRVRRIGLEADKQLHKEVI